MSARRRIQRKGQKQKAARLRESEKDVQEATALRDLHQQVEAAFIAKFNPPDEYGNRPSEYWPIDVFPEFVTCRKGGKTYRIGYTFQGGAVVFAGDELEEVEVEFVAVTEATPAPVLVVRESYRGTEVAAGKLLEAQDSAGWIWDVTIVAAGRTKLHTLPNGSTYVREYPKKVIAAAVPLFEGIGVFAFSGQEHAPSPGAKGVVDQVGYLENVRMVGSAMRGDLHLHRDVAWLRDRLLGLKESKRLEKAGLSIDAGGNGKWSKDGDLAVMTVEEITEASSVEIVHSPAAGGRVERLVASTGETKMNLEQILKLIEGNRPQLLEGLDRTTITMEQAQTLLAEAMKVPEAKSAAAKAAKATVPVTETVTPTPASASFAEAVAAIRASNDETRRIVMVGECGRLLDSQLSASALPQPVKDKIRKQFVGQVFEPAVLVEAMTGESEMLKALLAGGALPKSYGSVEITKEEREKKVHALEAVMWSGPQDATHPNFPAHLKGIRPYHSIKQAYAAIAGIAGASDRQIFSESAFAFSPVSEAEDPVLAARYYKRLSESLQTSDWAQVLGDSVRRRMIAEYTLPALQDWRKIVSEISSPPDFRTNYRMRIGGYGTLPVVAEQGTYTSLTSPTDEQESYAVSKKGGLDDITYEMIVNDDIGALRRLPVKLGRAAAQTLYRTVFDVIEDNDALADGVALVATATHGNLLTGALSNAQLTLARQTLMDQAAYGDSSEVLGLANIPRYLLHPNELAETAYQLTASWNAGQGEHDTASRNTNFHGSYGLEPLNVPYYAVATDFWVVADPAGMPTIEVGFLQGRQEPEIFVQNQPDIGSVFTADKITYKVRHIYNAIALDYRGFAGYIA